MISRIIEKPLKYDKSFFLIGPRGTGKTYWIKKSLPDSVYIDLLDTGVYTQFLAAPSRITEKIPPNYQGWIIIDEVQRVPELLNEAHRLIENHGYKFVLTGSSARALRKKGVNLLSGRALLYHMYPLTVQELGEQFDLKKSLQFGHLPAVFTEPDPKAYLKTYVHTYLREEVLQEGLTRNLSAFTRFLEIASFSQGCTLNMSAIARDTGVSQKAITGYFDILDDLLLGYRLPVFNKRAKRQTVNHPKFYYFDVGIYQVIRPRGLIDTVEEIEGSALETLFLQELRAINDYYDLEYQLYYWRTKTGLEVDFIIYGPHGLYAFEIKRSNHVNKKDCKNLKIFQEEYPEAKLYLIYGGEQRYYFDDVTAISITEVLKALPSIINESAK